MSINQLSPSIEKAVIRFTETFFVAGLASAALIPATVGVSYSDLRSYMSAIAIAFVAGGIMGVRKLVTEKQAQVQLDALIAKMNSAQSTTQAVPIITTETVAAIPTEPVTTPTV